MFDEGYTDYCEFLVAGSRYEEIQAQDSICGCLELLKSNRIAKLKDDLQNWSESQLKFLQK